MDEWLISHLGTWIVIILLAGSIADFFQFMWIVKRFYQRSRRRIFRWGKQHLLEAMKEDEKRMNDIKSGKKVKK